MRKLIKDRWTVAMLAGVLVFIALFIYATPYVNGSDQYWHYNYIQSILGGDYTSNELYPSFVLDPAWNGSLTGFIHNMPVLYIWAFFAWVTGSLYHGAMAFNALAAVLSAWFIYLVVKNAAGHKFGAAAFLTMLFFPLAFWQSVQLLTECSAMLFLCAAIYLFGRKSTAARLGTAALLALCANSRANALLIAVMVLVFVCRGALKEDGPARRTKLVRGLAPVALFIACYAGLRAVFGSTLDFTVSRSTLDRLAVVSTFNETTNMALHYSTQHFSDIGFGPMVGNFIGKLWTALVTQFSWTGSPSVLYWLQNLLFVAAAAALARQSRRERKNVFRYDGFWVLAVTAVSWAVSSVVYQNQFRYNLIYVPLLVVVLCVLLHRLGFEGGKRFGAVALAAVLLMTMADAGLAYASRHDAVAEHAEYTACQETLDAQIPADGRVAVIDPPWSQLPYPRVTTVIDSSYPYTEEQVQTLLLGRFETNGYIVTAHAARFGDPAYAAIIREHFTLCDEGSRFDIYWLNDG